MATLSLCMIVKNEEKHLPGCLKSAKEAVDEIIVVDTGSTDRTIEIAKMFGAKSYYFKWDNDFAAARNEAIKHATSDYILWMDADERLNKADLNKLLALKHNLPLDKKTAFAVEIVNYRKGKFPETAYQTRIFPNLPNIKFKGKICEQISFSLAESGINFKVSNVKIRHLGYLTPQIWKNKLQRNLPILKATLAQKGASEENWDIHYYLGISYLNLKEFSLAQEHLMQVLTKDCSFKNPSFYISAAIELAKLLKANGKDHQALQILLKLKSEFPKDNLVLCTLGKFLYEQKEYKKAIQALSQCQPQKIHLEVVPISKKDYIFEYYKYLGFCYEALNYMAQAITAFKKAIEVKPHSPYLIAHLCSLLLFKTNQIEEAIFYLIKGINLMEKRGIPTAKHEVYIALCLMLAIVFARQCRIEECVFLAERLLKSIRYPSVRLIHKLDELAAIYQEIGKYLQDKNLIWANLAFDTARQLLCLKV